MAGKDDKIIELLGNLNEKIVDVEVNTKIQAEKISQVNEKLNDIKDEQTRQNIVVTEHERRSTASEGTQLLLKAEHDILKAEHGIFKTEHEEFKTRIKVAEQPSLVLKNVWRALLTLGAGAGSMYAILRFLNELK